MEPKRNLYWPDNVTPKDIKFAMDRKHHALGMVPHCPVRRVLVQAGGCVGLYPILQSEHFETVYTFEPDPDNYRCLMANTKEYPNIRKFPFALGSQPGVRKFAKKQYSTGKLDDRGNVSVTVLTIDSLYLNACDAIQLDVEGHEVAILEGAARTIEQFSPVIQAECNSKPKLTHDNDPVYHYLTKIGYKVVREIGKDTIYSRFEVQDEGT